jgi:hypothetical protein
MKAELVPITPPLTAVTTQIWLVGSAVADLAIAVVLSWTVCISTLHIAFRIISVLQLLRARNKRFQGSHGIITRIVYLTVETNALTGKPFSTCIA